MVCARLSSADQKVDLIGASGGVTAGHGGTVIPMARSYRRSVLYGRRRMSLRCWVIRR